MKPPHVDECRARPAAGTCSPRSRWPTTGGFTLDLQLRYNIAPVLHMKNQRLDLVLLVVNTLNDPEAEGLSDSFSAKNSRFGQAFDHFPPLQAEVLIRYRN
jgi:hypothetical protein